MPNPRRSDNKIAKYTANHNSRSSRYPEPQVSARLDPRLPYRAVWEAASPFMKNRLSRNFANPSRPTEPEILAVCEEMVKGCDDKLEDALNIIHLYNNPRPELETLDFGGVYPAYRLRDKLIHQELGNGWFILYHPMIPYAAEVELYRGKTANFSWCLYVARGKPDSDHCINIDDNNGIGISYYSPWTGEWEMLERHTLVVPSYTILQVTFPGSDTELVSKEVIVSPASGHMSPHAAHFYGIRRN